MKNVEEVVWSDSIPEDKRERTLESIKFKKWFEKINKTFSKVEKLSFDSVDFFGDKVGFIKLKIQGVKDNERVKSICFIRGDSVAIFFVLKTPENYYVALVEQFRAPVGETIYECPAGMMDEDDNIHSVAIQEIAEELNFELNEEKLTYFTSLYNSPGGCDEETSLFGYIHECSEYDILKLHNRKTGVDSEDITVKVVPLNSFLDYNKTAIGVALYFSAILAPHH